MGASVSAAGNVQREHRLPPHPGPPPKVIVYKMRPKKHYRRKNGHRQPLSKFMVTRVG